MGLIEIIVIVICVAIVVSVFGNVIVAIRPKQAITTIRTIAVNPPNNMFFNERVIIIDMQI